MAKNTKNTTDLKIGSVLKAIKVEEHAPFELGRFYKITNGDCVGSFEVGNEVAYEYTIQEIGDYFEHIATIEDIENVEHKAIILKETYIQEEIMCGELSGRAPFYDLIIENTIDFLSTDEVFKGDKIELQFICDSIDITSVDKCVCCGKILLPDDEAYEDELRDGATLCESCSVFNEDTNMYQCSVKKEVIEKVTGLKFSEHLNDVDENIEEFNYWLHKNNLFFSINNKESKEIFIRFLNEFTEWNICDSCGLIEKSYDLAWVSSGDFTGDEYKAAIFACTKLNAEALCDTCLGSIENRTKLSLKDVVTRIKENKMIYREGDLVVLSNVNFADKKISNKTFIDYVVSIDKHRKTYRLKEYGDVEFIEEEFYDVANEAYIEEYTSFIATNYPDISDKVDEWSEESYEGIPEIESAFVNFGYKKEFIEYLKENNLPYGKLLTPKFKIGDSFTIHFDYYDEGEVTVHEIKTIDKTFNEANEIVYWDDNFVYITESELEKQKNDVDFDVEIVKNDILHNLFCLEEEEGIVVPTFAELLTAKEILKKWQLCEKYEDYSYDSVILEVNEQCENFFITLDALETARKNKIK